MTFTVSAGPLAALIAGVLILIIPRLLNYIIALYLIIVGILGLSGHARADAVHPARAHYVVVMERTTACGATEGSRRIQPVPARISAPKPRA